MCQRRRKARSDTAEAQVAARRAEGLMSPRSNGLWTVRGRPSRWSATCDATEDGLLEGDRDAAAPASLPRSVVAHGSSTRRWNWRALSVEDPDEIVRQPRAVLDADVRDGGAAAGLSVIAMTQAGLRWRAGGRRAHQWSRRRRTQQGNGEVSERRTADASPEGDERGAGVVGSGGSSARSTRAERVGDVDRAAGGVAQGSSPGRARCVYRDDARVDSSRALDERDVDRSERARWGCGSQRVRKRRHRGAGEA